MAATKRRVLTGVNSAGRSVVEYDHDAQAVLHTPGGGRIVEVWRTRGERDLASSAADVDAQPVTFAPAAGETSCRMVCIPPDSKRWGAGLHASELFASMGAMRNMSGGQQRHPGMHVTPTLDYVYVARGELVAVMEEGETRLVAGDVLVQRGTVHAWKNETDTDAEMFVVMIGVPGASASTPPTGKS